MNKFQKYQKIIFWGLLFLGLVMMHTHFTINRGDDLYFQNPAISEIFNWLGFRYNNWSSRIIIEAVLVFLLKLPSFFWFIMNSLVIMLIIYTISYIFTKKTLLEIVLVFSLFFLYPFYQLNEAGWYATTLNYLWPLALGLFSLIPIKNCLDGKKEKKYMYPLYIISLLYACNHELMCAIILTFYSLFLIYLWKEKKVDKFLIIQWLLAIGSLIFILTCPGNNLRNIQELQTWYPEYANFSMFQKGALGVLSTFSISFVDWKLPILLLSLIIPISLWNHKKILVKLNAFIPLIILGITKFLPQSFNIKAFFISFMNKVPEVPLNTLSMILLLIMCLIFILSIVVSLIFIFQKEENIVKKYSLALIYLAGVTSRVIMGFSPTLYASGQRTFLFYHVSMIICLLCIFLKISENKSKKILILIDILFFIVSMCMIIKTMKIA